VQERRTHPGFLSDGEAAREARRTEQMVTGFLRWNPVVRVGETDNFAIDYGKKERLIFIYGKETPKECPFKLAFNENEVSAILEQLAKARAFFQEH
jgi:hypothetical protein